MTRLLLLVLWPGLAAGPSWAQSPDARVVRADLAVSPDGRLAATSTGIGELLVWNAETWTLQHRVPADGSQVFGFDFSADSRYVSFGTKRGRLAVLDAATGEIVLDVQDRRGSVSATRFGPGGRLFAAGQGRWLTSYDWSSGTERRRYDLGASTLPNGRPLLVEDFDIVADRGWLFIARFDGQARLMDIGSGTVVHTWRNKRRPRDGNRNVKDVAVLSDARTALFTGVGGDIIFVDLVDGTRLDSVRVHPDFVSDVALDADGTRIAATDLDGTTTIVDGRTRSIVRRTTQDASFPSGRLLFAVAFRPDTDQLITGGIRLPLVVWTISTGERTRTIASLSPSP